MILNPIKLLLNGSPWPPHLFRQSCSSPQDVMQWLSQSSLCSSPQDIMQWLSQPSLCSPPQNCLSSWYHHFYPVFPPYGSTYSFVTMSGLVVSMIARVIFSLSDSCLPSFPHHLANFYCSFKDTVQKSSSRKPSPTTPASNSSSVAFSPYGFFCIFLLVLCFLWKHMASYTFYLFMYHQTGTHTHTHTHSYRRT